MARLGFVAVLFVACGRSETDEVRYSPFPAGTKHPDPPLDADLDILRITNRIAHEFDANMDHTITLKEIKDNLPHDLDKEIEDAGTLMTLEGYPEKLFANFDGNQDGFVHIYEIRNYLYALFHMVDEEKLKLISLWTGGHLRGNNPLSEEL